MPFHALLAFTLVLVTAPQAAFPALAPLRPGVLTAVVAGAALLGDRLVRRAPVGIVNREIVLAGALAAWTLACVPFSYWPGGSLSFLFESYFKTLVVFWLLANVVDDPARLCRIVWALGLMTVPVAATAVRNYLDGVVVGVAAAGVGRIAGYDAPLTSNPNDLALLVNLILPLAAGLLVSRRTIAARAALAGIVLLDVGAVVATFSRGGFLTLATTGTLFASRLVRSGRGAWVAAACALAILAAPAAVPAGYLDQIRTIGEVRADSTGSAQERWRDMAAATRVVLEHPLFGVGPGMNVLALNETRGTTWRMVHNVYLETATDLGLPGLCLFLLLFAGCLRSARAARREASARDPDGELAWLASGIEISLLGFAVAALFHPVSYQFFFYYVAALAIAAKAIAARPAIPEPR